MFVWQKCFYVRHLSQVVSNVLMNCPDFFWGPFYKHGLTSIPAWISNHIHHKVWDEITYPFPNFNGTTVEVWEWVSNFIPHFTGHVITYYTPHTTKLLGGILVSLRCFVQWNWGFVVVVVLNYCCRCCCCFRHAPVLNFTSNVLGPCMLWWESLPVFIYDCFICTDRLDVRC